MAEAVALLSAGVSYFEAEQSNKNARAARDQTIGTTNVAARQRQTITARNLAELEGSIRASSAGRGVGGSESSFALGLSARESGLFERQNIELERYGQVAAAQSRYASQYTNPLLAGIGGAVEGYMLASDLGAGSMFAASAPATATSSVVGGAVGAPGSGIFFPNAIPGVII